MDANAIGIVGTTLLLLCFVANQFGFMGRDSLLYDGGNFFGALLLAIYAYDNGSWIFVVIMLAWAGISLRDFIRDAALKG